MPLFLRVFASLLLLALSGLSLAEPPLRAARLGYIGGTVSFSQNDQPEWVQAVVNRPLTTGDRLWADANSRAELQVGGASIRLGPETDMTLLKLDDRIAQLQVQQGVLNLRVRRLGDGQSFEIDTPNLAFTVSRPGNYRVDVDPNGNTTAVMVRSGRGEVYGQTASYTVEARRGYRFFGADLADYQALAAQPDDDFDRWTRARDRNEDESLSVRYVSPDVVGYQDLDTYGIWSNDPSYGYVWMPTRVVAGWTPYRDGHWTWVDPWGWTWVDDAPWGFAVSHYGRWANFSGRWGWVPGPVRERAVYAPALVVFMGGSNFRVRISGGGPAPAVGWFPLAPREVYRPSYPVSRSYFDSINRSNAVIAPTTITNVYNTTIVKNTTNITKVVYVNQKVTGAVVAVPAQTFTQSQPVARAAVPVSVSAAVGTPVTPAATVAPGKPAGHGGTPVADVRPPRGERPVVTRTAPPTPAVPATPTTPAAPVVQPAAQIVAPPPVTGRPPENRKAPVAADKPHPEEPPKAATPIAPAAPPHPPAAPPQEQRQEPRRPPAQHQIEKPHPPKGKQENERERKKRLEEELAP